MLICVSVLVGVLVGFRGVGFGFGFVFSGRGFSCAGAVRVETYDWRPKRGSREAQVAERAPLARNLVARSVP
jgi:hypothetical protein